MRGGRGEEVREGEGGEGGEVQCRRQSSEVDRGEEVARCAGGRERGCVGRGGGGQEVVYTRVVGGVQFPCPHQLSG